MTAVSARDLLLEARSAGRILGSFNCFDLQSAAGIVDGAERHGSPVILAVSERHLKLAGVRSLAATMRALADEASMPVVVHLDHARVLDTVALCVREGFDSLMFDGYGLDWEEKIAQTRAASAFAHGVGATMETELGHIGRPSAGEEGAPVEVADASRFVAETEIDTLAAAVGSAHGLSEGEGSIDLDLLERLHSETECFLSLHGGSGIPREELAAAASRGVAKVSVFTRIAQRATRAAIAATGGDSDVVAIGGAVRAAFSEGVTEVLDYLPRGGTR